MDKIKETINMIHEFITAVKTRGLARTNRYRAHIIFPFKVSDTERLVSLFCDQIFLPGVNIETTPQRIYGESREMPYNRIFEPVRLSFYVDNDFIIKDAFDRWLGLVINPKTRELQYYKDYTRDLIIDVFNIEDNLQYSIKLYEVYPKTVDPITLDYASKDIMKLNVTLQYKWWEINTMDNIEYQ